MSCTLIICSTFSGNGGYCFREIRHEDGQITACGQEHPDIDGAELEAENYFGHVRWHRRIPVNGVYRQALEGMDYGI